MKVLSPRLGYVQRSQGQSALAAASYLEDRTMRDRRLGESFRYGSDKSKKHKTTVLLKSRIEGKHVIDTEALWNAAEEAERKSNARIARRIMLPLPNNLTKKQHRKIVNQFRKELEKKYGVATTAVIHYEHEHNPHAHLMFTVREVKFENGKAKFGAKTRILDDKKTGPEELENIRKTFCDICNRFLKENEKVTNESYKRQGIDKIATRHMGKAYYLEQKGIKTEIGEYNRQVQELNARKAAIKAEEAEIKTLTQKLEELKNEPEPANFEKRPGQRHDQQQNESSATGGIYDHPGHAGERDQRETNKNRRRSVNLDKKHDGGDHRDPELFERMEQRRAKPGISLSKDSRTDRSPESGNILAWRTFKKHCEELTQAVIGLQKPLIRAWYIDNCKKFQTYMENSNAERAAD